MKHRDDELDVVIREMKRQEYPLLEDFLWQAIDIPEGMDPPPRSILHTPALQVYLAGFGGNRSDQAFVAEIDGRVVGAAWARIMKDYGHIDAHTPSLAISVWKEFRGRGIGSALVRALLESLKKSGYSRVSLSVQRANPARRMYERAGFRIFEQRGEEYLMIAHLTD